MNTYNLIRLTLYFSFISLASSVENTSDNSGVVIETKYGNIEGELVRVDETGFVAAVFKGIRYGTAERFEKPQSVQPWTGTTKQAKTWGNRCPQHQYMGAHDPVVPEDVSEDCLYLNVFAPYPTKSGQSRLPVMIFIHGGALADGSSNQYGQDGIVEWILPKGVVFVTLNYRLGPFGFFSTGANSSSETGNGAGSASEYGSGNTNGNHSETGSESGSSSETGSGAGSASENGSGNGPSSETGNDNGSDTAPGNYGFWDQTLALKWVRENIDRFGGDPDRVTVLGESAGALSVGVLTISPHSSDLFQQAILISGSTFIPGFEGGRDSNSVELSEWLANELGCGSFEQTQQAAKKRTLDCVKSKSISDILELANSLGRTKNKWTTVIDGDFLPEPIEQLHRIAPPKPTIIGTTRDEAGIFITPPLPRQIETQWLIDDYDSFTLDEFRRRVASLFGDSHNANLSERLALDHYVDSVGDRRNSTFLVDKFKEIMSDWLFKVPSYKEAVQRRNRGSPVWLYSFDYFDHAIFQNDQKRQGAFHFLDMPYLFKWRNYFHPSPWKGNDLKIADLFITLFTNFAIHGNPTPENSPLRKDFDWETIDDEYPYRYLRIDLDPKQEEFYARRGISFWLELLPDVIGGGGMLEQCERR